jgi:methyltransferase (TIGR00027 family)
MADASNAIQHVSDTALWVALYRAIESERPDALFHDPYARRLAGERGERVFGAMPKARSWGWPMVVRTAVMDELILKAAAGQGFDTVLNLAAGLDARPYRLALPPTLRWIDVDFPDMIAYRREHLSDARPACRVEQVGLDLRIVSARRSLFTDVGRSARGVLVVSEGLLVYLEPAEVAALARDLAGPPSFQRWLTDIAGPRILKRMEKTWGKVVAAGNAPFRFAPAEGTRFFDRHGWTEAEFRSTWDEANRLGRADVRFAWLWRLLARISSEKRREEGRRMAGIVVLERC